ncbi:hypothetical protein [Paracoccus sp. (in: a-proteobacteria)]|uniref:hypothetical protein n=1 Tax=Paracoccus sp. TaxID=267 RepID=UPI002AFFEAFD|nr:hypothetical protein [Paracoccus sp. (in: a-proteobacteria)]
MSEEAKPRLWWPEFLGDEVMPTGHEKPETWLAEQDDGTYLFGSVKADEEGRFPEAEPVEAGERLRFTYLDQMGRHTITVRADRTHSSVAVPEGYTDVWEVGEPDNMATSLAALVEIIADRLSPGDEETADIEFLRWGDASFTLGLTDRQRPLLIPVSEPADA